jgi:hypothetical protein
MYAAPRDKAEKMKQKKDRGEQGAEPGPSPGSETERFRAIVDPRHNEAVTGESGVPRKLRDHELKCQRESLEEFS